MRDSDCSVLFHKKARGESWLAGDLDWHKGGRHQHERGCVSGVDAWEELQISPESTCPSDA